MLTLIIGWPVFLLKASALADEDSFWWIHDNSPNQWKRGNRKNKNARKWCTFKIKQKKKTLYLTILRIFLDKTFDDLQTSIEIIKIKSSKLAASQRWWFHMERRFKKLRISWLRSLHPKKLTRNPKMDVCKVIFRFLMVFTVIFQNVYKPLRLHLLRQTARHQILAQARYCIAKNWGSRSMAKRSKRLTAMPLAWKLHSSKCGRLEAERSCVLPNWNHEVFAYGRDNRILSVLYIRVCVCIYLKNIWVYRIIYSYMYWQSICISGI